ncbi:MAG: hypothetical protein R2844_03475 [Caldilineales bacterium]
MDTGTIVTLINRPGALLEPLAATVTTSTTLLMTRQRSPFENNCTTGANPTQAYVAGDHYQGGDPASSTLMTAFDGEDPMATGR